MSTGRFIVVFKSNVTPTEIEKYASEVAATGGQVYQRLGLLNGFAATITEAYLSQLQGLQGVIDYIEPDGIVTTQ